MHMPVPRVNDSGGEQDSSGELKQPRKSEMWRTGDIPGNKKKAKGRGPNACIKEKHGRAQGLQFPVWMAQDPHTHSPSLPCS